MELQSLAKNFLYTSHLEESRILVAFYSLFVSCFFGGFQVDASFAFFKMVREGWVFANFSLVFIIKIIIVVVVVSSSSSSSLWLKKGLIHARQVSNH